MLVASAWAVLTSLVTRSRMFMRAMVSEEERVGLLLLDEPSAALDPTAEHGTSTDLR